MSFSTALLAVLALYVLHIHEGEITYLPNNGCVRLKHIIHCTYKIHTIQRDMLQLQNGRHDTTAIKQMDGWMLLQCSLRDSESEKFHVFGEILSLASP